MTTTNSNIENKKAIKTVKTAKAPKVAKAQIAKVETEATPSLVAEVIKTPKAPIVRKTSDEKVNELKQAIERQFGVNQEQITNFTIQKLAKSSKKVNLIDFYETLIVQMVLTPELIFKF